MNDKSRPSQRFVQVYRNGRRIMQNVEHGLQGGIALYELSNRPRDVDSYRKLFDSIQYFVNRNPLGRLFTMLYQLHFDTLFEAMETSNIEHTKLQENFELLLEEIKWFIKDSKIIIESTTLDRRKYLRGPGQLAIKILNEDSTLSGAERNNLYPRLESKAKNIVKDLDDLLSYYVKVQELWSLSYKASEKALSSEKPGTPRHTYSLKLRTVNWTDFRGANGTNFNGKLQDLFRNREDWAEWVGMPSVSDKKKYLKRDR